MDLAGKFSFGMKQLTFFFDILKKMIAERSETNEVRSEHNLEHVIIILRSPISAILFSRNTTILLKLQRNRLWNIQMKKVTVKKL